MVPAEYHKTDRALTYSMLSADVHDFVLFRHVIK